jgi:hypothetical protein
MPRSLAFSFKDATFDAQIIKVDRSHLYGSVSVETATMDGERCDVATLAVDGKTLIPTGGTALGYVNPDGEWVDRDELQPVDLSGNPVDEVESSFDAPIVLDTECDADVFLDHSVRLVYRLKTDTELPKAIVKKLQSGTIYQFGFSYRGGVGYDPAFVLADDDDNIWMMVTTPNDIQTVGLEQAAICYGESLDEDTDDEADDTIDFNML